jgi:hypothetical protein
MRNMLILTAIPALFAIAVWYAGCTSGGGRRLVVALIERYGDVIVTMAKADGALLSTLTLHQVKVVNIPGTPPGTMARIQQVRISPLSRWFGGPVVEIINGRLEIPGSDIVFIQGTYASNWITGTLYCRRINMALALESFPVTPEVETLDGTVRSIDLNIRGTLRQIYVYGDIDATRIAYEGFSGSDLVAGIEMLLKESRGEWTGYGIIRPLSGKLSGPNTATINLQESDLVFRGPLLRPLLTLEGMADIEGVRVQVGLRGAADSPDLRLSSRPSLPDRLLLLMLATGRRWRSLEKEPVPGQLPAGITFDFLNYFIFGASGETFVNKLGMRDLQIIVTDGTRGIGLRTGLGERADIMYRFEQTRPSVTGPQETRQIVGGQVEVTDRLSVEGSRTITETPGESGEREAEDRVLFRFKMSF